MKARLLIAILLLPLGVAAQRRPSPPPDAAFPLITVRVNGAQHFPEADIVAAAGLAVGQKVTTAQLQQGADLLLSSGAFEEVSFRFAPAGAGMKVEFTVKEADHFLPVAFDNLVWCEDADWVDMVHRHVPLFHGEVPELGEMTTQVADVLQDWLRERGIPATVNSRLDADIHPIVPEPGTMGTPPAGKVTGLRYFVEGVAVQVRDVSFPGVTPEQAAKLTVAGQRLLKMPFQHSTAEDFAAYNLRPILHRMGYLKPTFGKLSVKLVSEDAKKPIVAVSIPVDPGMQYRLGALRWSGNTAFPAADLQTFLRARVGAPMDLPGMLEDLAKVNTAYASRGYLRQYTEEIPSYDDAMQMVSYELRVREGDQYKFEDVTFTGVERAVQDKLRELWTMRTGEPYNPGYFMTFRESAARLLSPGMIAKADLQIDDRHKTVELTIAISFQKREP